MTRADPGLDAELLGAAYALLAAAEDGALSDRWHDTARDWLERYRQRLGPPRRPADPPDFPLEAVDGRPIFDLDAWTEAERAIHFAPPRDEAPQ